MKKFTQMFESCIGADVNQGNNIKLGVTNHYTPIQNVVTNIRNLFSTLPIFVCVAEDGVSIEIHSTKFVSMEAIDRLMITEVCRTCLDTYIYQQGLNGRVKKPVGQYWVLYCTPTDIAAANPYENTKGEPAASNGTKENIAVCEDPKNVKKNMTTKIKEMLVEDIEIIKEGSSDEDEEIEDLTKAKLKEIINSTDKVKAAKQLSLLVAQEMELPNDYYFAGVTSKPNNDNSIALRWRYTKRGGHNSTIEIVKTLINIFGTNKDGIFVPDFAKDSMFKLPDAAKKLIENLLNFLGAEKTNDECVYSLSSLGDKKDDDKKEDKKDDSKDDTSNNDEDKKDDNLGGDNKDNDSSKDDLLG